MNANKETVFIGHVVAGHKTITWLTRIVEVYVVIFLRAFQPKLNQNFGTSSKQQKNVFEVISHFLFLFTQLTSLKIFGCNSGKFYSIAPLPVYHSRPDSGSFHNLRTFPECLEYFIPYTNVHQFHVHTCGRKKHRTKLICCTGIWK